MKYYNCKNCGEPIYYDTGQDGYRNYNTNGWGHTGVYDEKDSDCEIKYPTPETVELDYLHESIGDKKWTIIGTDVYFK